MTTSQKNILTRERVTFIGLESTYGSYAGSPPVFTPPSGTWPYCVIADVLLMDDIRIDGLSEAREDVISESTFRVDPHIPYHGLRIATTVPGISKYCQGTPYTAVSGTTAQMNAYWVRPTTTGAPAAGATATSLMLIAALGGGTYASDQTLTPPTFDQPGSVAVAAGSTTTVVNVTTGTGVQFNAGTWIAVQTGSGAGYPYQAAKVISIATDALTIYPALSAVPVDGAIVKNLYNYFPAEVHGTGPGVASPNGSLVVETAFVGSTADQTALQGVFGDVSFEFTQGDKAVMMKFGGKATDFTGPAALGLSVAPVVDTMGAITRFTPQIYIQSSTANGAGSGSFPVTITRGATLTCPKFTIEVKGAWEMIRDLNAPQTVAGVLDAAGRPRFGKVVFTTRWDDQPYVDFAANPDVLYNIVVIQTIGNGAQQSFWIWEISCATLVAEPKATKVGEYTYVDMEFNPLPDGTQAAQFSYATPTMPVLPGSPTPGMIDACRAAFRTAFG
jgi:hypothetical protein